MVVDGGDDGLLMRIHMWWMATFIFFNFCEIKPPRLSHA